MIRLKSLLRNTRGVATVEFAFASLLMFGTIMVALDFGYNIQQKLKLGSAIEQASIIAYNQQIGSNTSVLTNFVTAAAGTQTTPSVTVTCNGTSTCGDGKCSCINSTGGFVMAASCNATCSGSSAVSGNYMKIVATTTYNSVIVPDKYLGGKTITSSAVVRLQ
jgi:Flp pilus assembly protein TadG